MAFKKSKVAVESPKVSDSASGKGGVRTQAGDVLNGSVKDGLVLACVLFAVFLFIVLFSYDPRDAGFEESGAGQIPLNYGGKTGAWLASFVLYLFGIFGFLIPFGVFMAGVVTLKIRATSKDVDYAKFGLSLLGLLVLIISGAGLATLFFPPNTSLISLPYSGGGVLGYELSHFLVSGVDLLGATLILLGLFVFSFSLFTSFSWLTIIEVTGQGAFWLYEKLRKFAMDKLAVLNLKYPWLKRMKKGVVSEGSQDIYDKEITEDVVSSENNEPNLSKKTAKNTKVSSAIKAVSKVVKPASKETEKNELSEKEVGKEVEQGDENKVASDVKVGQREAANATVSVQQSGELPSVELLDPIPEYEEGFSEEALTSLSLLLEKSLSQFGIDVDVESVQPGPVVTQFQILPAPGVKVSQINNLAKDLARVLSVKSVRVVDVIPGKTFVGIEIPNAEREMVSFREVISSEAFQQSTSPLTVVLGKDIAGKAVVTDLAKAPHLLVAGTTGSGKSVGVNSMILSILYKATAKEVRLIMIDPKMLELSIYEDIPHLLTPVVTDMTEAANALRWCVFEMDRRYQLMSKLGVRNIAGYNAKVQGAIDDGKPIIDPLYQQAANFGHELGETPPTLEPLPFIVVLVDEFADMIMVVGKEVEQLIARLAQKARAAGIHLVLATQRPSVNVITGLIKSNIPTRISFMLNTKIDSRTILDQGGAEQLLGMGDMLFMPPGNGNPQRVHGAFMTDEEVHKVVSFVKSQGEPQYLSSVTQSPSEPQEDEENGDAEQDKLYDEVVEFVIEGRRVSVSSVQRRFKIGYNRAARIVEAMERTGVVSTMGANGNREVLVPKSQD